MGFECAPNAKASRILGLVRDSHAREDHHVNGRYKYPEALEGRVGESQAVSPGDGKKKRGFSIRKGRYESLVWLSKD